MARIDATLRRVESAYVGDEEKVYHYAGMTLNFRGGRVRANGESLRLTLTEYQLLYHLVVSPGTSVSKETLLGDIWVEEYRTRLHYLTSSITRLKETLRGYSSTHGLTIQDEIEGYSLMAS